MKKLFVVVIALILSIALGLLVTTVDAQSPPLPPDGLCSEVWWCSVPMSPIVLPLHPPVSPLSPVAPPLPPDVPGVVPVSPIAPPLPADGDVDVIGAQVSPMPEPTPLCWALDWPCVTTAGEVLSPLCRPSSATGQPGAHS